MEINHSSTLRNFQEGYFNPEPKTLFSGLSFYVEISKAAVSYSFFCVTYKPFFDHPERLYRFLRVLLLSVFQCSGVF